MPKTTSAPTSSSERTRAWAPVTESGAAGVDGEVIAVPSQYSGAAVSGQQKTPRAVRHEGSARLDRLGGQALETRWEISTQSSFGTSPTLPRHADGRQAGTGGVGGLTSLHNS